MKLVTCIEDLRELHRRRVPRAFFDYADSGSYNEETLRANRADLEKLKLRQKVLVDVSDRSLATTVVGQSASAPLILAPVGLTGRQHGNGEILAAEAATRRAFRSRCRPCLFARSRTWPRRRESR